MRFKLRQMEVFRAVMQTGSMNGAARLLSISQPAVSRLVSYTEQSLGLRLFDRSRGKLRPTAEAVLLYQEVGALYEEAVRIDELARDLATKPAGALNLGSSPSLALHFMPPIIAKLISERPGLRIRYRTLLSFDIPRELQGRHLDLAVCAVPIDHPDLVVESITTGRMVVILPPRHPLAEVEQVGLRELSAYPLILYSRQLPLGQMMNAAFQRIGLEWRATIDILRAEQACSLVRAGIGVSVVDEFSVSKGWPGVIVRPLTELIPLTVSLIRSRHVEPSKEALDFCRLLRSVTATPTGGGVAAPRD